MKFGFQLMLRGVASSPEGLTAVVQKGEQSGFDIVAPNDHILVPAGIDSTYPYSENGVWAGASVVDCHDQLTALTFIAGKTEQIKILTSVMVVPYREPVLTAKIISSADVLSKGRIIVGCGAGWMQEEMDAIGAPPFKERGKVTDEYLSIFKELWTKEDPAYDGEYAKFKNIHFKPKPVQKPHPPIWIGGESKAALRRTARLGNGWFPAANNPKFRIDSPDSLKDRLDTLRQLCDEEKRDFAELDLGFFYTGVVSSDPVTGEGRKRRMFSGKPEDIIGDIESFRDVGLGTIIFRMERPSLMETLDLLEWFGSEVKPLFKNK
ncbi:TIGR03619 family F420-dependent LLM class oxidoreductase [Alphaproteobacteria bacterium]|nr:TIGR03619 family F420-dependent LLM class oxidoreductase [Alphaproteobacteria bacterium]|tara:strand:+ start:640 stop:1602 length:963 start_codon:yes stop_codon:yes gene_type:complete